MLYAGVSMGIYELSGGPSQMLRGGGLPFSSHADNFLLFIHITSWGEALRMYGAFPKNKTQ